MTSFYISKPVSQFGRAHLGITLLALYYLLLVRSARLSPNDRTNYDRLTPCPVQAEHSGGLSLI